MRGAIIIPATPKNNMPALTIMEGIIVLNLKQIQVWSVQSHRLPEKILTISSANLTNVDHSASDI